MKRFLLYSLMACMAWCMQSCLFSEDELFEVSSAERENAAVQEFRQLLTSSPDGWKLMYRYGSAGEKGAANIFVKFTDGEVAMASDFSTSDYEAGNVETSRYSVQAYQGTMLTFDSYNKVLHSFCQPNSYQDPGYQGDYEFIVRSVSENEVVLTGKKYGLEMVLSRLDAATDWTAYLVAAAAIDEASDYSMFNMMQGGASLGKIQRSGRAFVLPVEDEFGSVSYTYCPFICTDRGISLVEPLSVGGVMVRNFEWNNETNTFVCMDEGVDMKWVFERPANYDRYIGKYKVVSGKKSFGAEIKQKKDGKSYEMTQYYQLTGGGTWVLTLELYFDADRDDISVAGQSVGTFGGIPVYLYPGQASGNFYADVNSVFEGTTVEKNGTIEISFVNNPYSSVGCYDWLFIYEQGGYRAMDIWENPVFTKIVE